MPVGKESIQKKKKPTALNHLRELDCTHSIYIVSSMDHKVLNICMQHAKKKKKIKTEYKVKLLVSILVHLDPQLHLTVVLRAHLPVPVLTRGTIFAVFNFSIMSPLCVTTVILASLQCGK